MAELNLKQIIDRLNAEFTGETRKLVFWYDDKAEFAEDMETVELQNAKIYHLQPDNQFYTKYFLERVDKTTNYLIYAPFPKPDVRDNHLEDTMLYSRRFFADRASLLSVDLGIEEKYKPVIEKHIKFFANKERTQRFYDLEIENFNEENILVGLLLSLIHIYNIVSLMITSIDDDRISLKTKVEDALKVLMRQMLIQKNGSIYVFLTDEEQEINNEIEKENVEMPEVITKIAEMIYEDIFSSKKYQYPSFSGRYAFSFNQAVDDRPYKANQNYDIGLRVLTPWYEGGTDDGTLRLLSGQGKEVLVVLPNDDAFLTEMRAYLKIERFLRKNTSVQLAKYETIKEAKRVEMRERNGNAKLYLTEALKEATIYVNGDVLHTSGKEVTSRINEAIGRLVQTVYHKLSYIDAAMGEADIRKMFKTSNQLSLALGDTGESNVHALDDVLQFVAGNSRMHMKTSLKTIKDRFMKAPYGFVEDDIHWLVARLFKRGDLSFTCLLYTSRCV